MKILLIDDNERLAQLYQTLLVSNDFETMIQSDPTQALDSIHSFHPDIVLLDIMMDPIPGWEVLDLIRADPEYNEIPVIILTGKVLTLHEAIRYGLQIEGYVMKPLEKTMLISVIQELSEILDECESRYRRAIQSGLSIEQATKCRSIARKQKMLVFLKHTLQKQEQLLNLRPEEHDSLVEPIDELRNIINQEFSKINETLKACP